ncbi:MAG: hypothetical protein LQ344_005742 [Seirophora lacunosa]|nr:MAG: hypothetical protein LQ344_005742 [Seirophora lacunosa]
MLVPALLSAGFVLTANAFLLPPEVATTPNNAPKNHLISNLPQSRTITLDCSECPFALASQRNGRHEWTHSVKSDLELTFTTDNDMLKLNGVPVYPVLPPPSVPAPVLVKQTKKSEDDEAMAHQGYEGDLTLSYSIEVHNMKSSSGAQQGITATEITFSILGLDNEVAHVDDIKIKTLSLPNPSTAQDELLIVAVDSKPTDGNSVDAQCATIICRAMHRFRSAAHRVKSHAKTAAYKMKCICIKCMNAMRHAHYHRPSRPLQAGQPTRLPTHNRAFARASRLIFSYALLPIVVGIMFGIATSAIGMLVGQLVVAIWLRLRRTSSKGGAYQRVESEEKEGLPRYEDLEDGTTVTDEKA